MLPSFYPSSPSLLSYLEHVNLMKVSTLTIISRGNKPRKEIMKIISILAAGFSFFCFETKI